MVHVLLLGLWMGGVAFFGVLCSTAPEVVASAHTTSQLQSEILARMDGFGLIAGPILLLSLVLGWSPIRTQIRYRAAGVVFVTVLVGISSRWIAPRKEELMAAIGRRLEDVDHSTALMMELTQLEHISLGLLIAHGLVAAMLVISAVGSGRTRRRYGIEL